MDLNFSNGNRVQQGACSFVAENLLGLPSEAIPITIDVSFVSDPDPSVHNEFAATDYAYDTGTATMEIRSDAPNFGGPFDGMPFFQETVAHELGHIIFANIGEAARLQVVELFGGDTDDLGVINNSSLKWEDRIIEGIAETFKDAFFRPALRRYSNRTNQKIPIHKYSEFRAIFRDAIPSIGEDLHDQLHNLPVLDDLQSPAVNPIADPWVLWSPATNIGKVTSGIFAGYVSDQYPGKSGALYTDSFLSGPHAVAARIEARSTSTLIANETVELLACASNDGGGEGYKLVAHRKFGGSVPPNADTYELSLEYWKGGSLESTLKQGDAQMAIDSYLAIVILGGNIQAWVRNTSGTFIWEMILSAVHDSLKSGYPGIRQGRTNNSQDLPSMVLFKAGAIKTGQSIELPNSQINRRGTSSGRLKKPRTIVGRSI